jgi:hypothetical protein
VLAEQAMKSRNFGIERLPECFTQTGNHKQRQVISYGDIVGIGGGITAGKQPVYLA